MVVIQSAPPLGTAGQPARWISIRSGRPNIKYQFSNKGLLGKRTSRLITITAQCLAPQPRAPDSRPQFTGEDLVDNMIATSLLESNSVCAQCIIRAVQRELHDTAQAPRVLVCMGLFRVNRNAVPFNSFTKIRHV